MVYSWSRFSVIFTGSFVAFFPKSFGVTGVFLGSAMVVVAAVISLFGPRTNQLALEQIAQ